MTVLLTNKKLGRKAVVVDSRTLRLSKYFTAQLPPPPAAVDWSKGQTSWGELLNNSLGCCTCAAVGHAIQVWTVNATVEATVTDAEVMNIYEKWCGYNPSDPSTDAGGVELYVLGDWKSQGFAGTPLKAFAQVLPANQIHVEQAINLFIGLYIGMEIPAYIMPDDGNVPTFWDLDPTADNSIIGGHAVFVTGYDAKGPKFISWGSNYQMSWQYWAKNVDEAYALISPAMFEASGDAPNGFSLDALETDLVNIS
jgi:hypothetical protein